MLRFLQSLPLTFYSIPFYRDLVSKGKGAGLGFLLIVTLINLGAGIVAMAGPYTAFRAEEKALFDALPEVSVENGTLSIDAASPKEITIFQDQKEGPLKIVFDMSVTTSDVDALTQRMADQHILLLATKNKVIVYDKSQKKTDVRDVSSLSDTKITHEQWGEIERLVSLFLAPVLILVLSLLVFLGHLMSAFAGAILLLVVAPLFRVDPSLGGAMRLSSAAKIPVAVLFLLLPPNLAMRLLVWFGFAAFGLLAGRNKPVQG